MKILFITDGLYPFVLGGMQKHATYMLQNFANTEHHCTVITTAENPVSHQAFAEKIFGGTMPPNMEFHFVPFPKLPHFPGHYVLASWLYSKRIGKTWQQRLKQFDIIYTKGFSGWYLLQNKNEQTPPIAAQLHGLEMFQPAYSFRDTLVKTMLRIPAKAVIQNADFIFSYGGKIRDILLSLGKNPNAIIEQYGAVDAFWIDPPPMPKANAAVRKFLFVARYEFRKGYHILKPVVEKLLQERKDFELDFVGQIPQELQISHPNIRYHGNLPAEQIKLLKAASEILLVPSLAEGFPTILVEAMARGLAPLATDVGAVSAVVKPENGWLIPPANADALEHAMKAAIDMDAPALTAMQNAAREIVLELFNWKYMHNNLVSQLQKIAHDHR